MGVSMRRMENNIKTYLQGIRRGRVDWIILAQDRNKLWTVANTAMKFQSIQMRRIYWSTEKKKKNF